MTSSAWSGKLASITSTKSLKITHPWLQPMNFGSDITLRKKTPGATSVTTVSVGLNQPTAIPAATSKKANVDPATSRRLRWRIMVPSWVRVARHWTGRGGGCQTDVAACELRQLKALLSQSSAVAHRSQERSTRRLTRAARRFACELGGVPESRVTGGLCPAREADVSR